MNAFRFGLGLASFATLTAAATLPAQVPVSTAKLEVIGGPHAGKHTLVVDDVGCEIVKAGTRPKYFNVNFGNDSKNPKELTFVLVRIRNANGPGAPAKSDYEVTIVFGPMMDDRLETVYMSGSDPRSTTRKGGTGTVLLEDSGKGDVTVTLDLQPQAGVAIKGTVTCTKPMRR